MNDTDEHAQQHEAIQRNMDELSSALFGTDRSDLEGGGKNEDGMVHRLARIEKGQEDIVLAIEANGTSELKLTRSQIVASVVVWLTLLAGVVGVAAAILR